MSDVGGYLGLLADRRRVRDFREAVERTVRDSDLVLDLGTGLGTYAMFAAARGARVYGIESDDVIELARRLAAENGLADRIRFLSGRAEHLEPPDRARVLIYEDFAPGLFEPSTARLLSDVRDRWLVDDAVAIPRAVRAMLAPVSAPETYAELVPWPDEQAYGLTIAPAQERALNSLHRAVWSDEVLLASPAAVGRVDPLAPETFRLSTEASWTVERSARLHGLGLWMELDLAEGITYSNAPGRRTPWGQVLLPLAEAASVEAGDRVRCEVTTVGAGTAGCGWWRWRVTVGDAEWEMNSFRGQPLTMERLWRADPAARARLSPTGQARRALLELVDEGHTFQDVAAELGRRFPGRFRRDGDAYRAIAAELRSGDITVGEPGGASELESDGG